MKLNRPIICIDLETTGLDVNEDRIVQLAFIRLNVDGTRAEKCRTINPQRPIPREATDVHGLGDGDVEGEPEFAQVAKSLHKALSNCDLSGYNAKYFDIPMLAAEFKRCGIEWPAPDTRVVDSYLIFKRKEPHKLSNALEFYTGELIGDGAHDALVDARAALDVLIGQADRYCPDRDGLGVDELIELSVDPDWIDEEGKAKWLNGVAVINFGKWKDVPLHKVDPGYFDWVVKNGFNDDFKAICIGAKAGKFPTRGSL